ncbi:MAG TPA: HAD-IA family hydrolase, partial [Chloroflexia bacterium]|nr:HAD-IA family hydrolase [Chloroflexia bacterium]
RTCLGRELSRQEILPTLGRALLECFEEVAPGRSEELRAAYRAYQQTTHDTMVTLVPGTREMLERLRDAGLRLGVVTSKGLVVAMEGLDLFELAPYFDTFVTYEDTTRHKPHPDPLLVASERLGVEPDDLVYVGDAVVDVQAGKAAGMRTVAVTWGSGEPEALARAEPDYLSDSIGGVATLLLSEQVEAEKSINVLMPGC